MPLQFNKSNKMTSTYQKLKTEQSTLFTPANSFLNLSANQAGFAYLNKRPQEIRKSISLRQASNVKLKEKSIKEQNIRLIAKIIDINNRKYNPNSKNSSAYSKKRKNPERQRTISLQNQRLGKSLIMIKTGKSIARIKTQIAQNIKKSSQSGLNLFRELSSTQRRKGMQGGFFLQGKNTSNINIDSLLISKQIK